MSKTSNLNHFIASLIQRCESMVHLRQIHAHMIITGLSQDRYFSAKIISFCAISSLGDINYSYQLFLQLPSRNVFDYNTLIRGYSKSKNPNAAIALYAQMLLSGVLPDHMTFPFMVKACARLSSLRLGEGVHCHVVRMGLDLDVYVLNSLLHMYSACRDIVSAQKVFAEIPHPNLVSWNAMVDGYAKCGDIGNARRVFDSMLEHDVISWSALICGYVECGDSHEALALFSSMRAAGCKANEVTMVSVLCACADLGALDRGRLMHQYIEDNGIQLSLTLRTSLIDMYAKCGSIEDALHVFERGRLEAMDVLIWNAMIGGLAMHGHGRESLNLFKEMQSSCVVPDEITYLALLGACAHGGQVDDALKFFKLLRANGMVPMIEHYASIVDALSRAGRLDEAYKFMKVMPMKPTASMLGALLNGCRIHKRADLGEIVGKTLIELQPDHDGRYIGLSNVYAMARRWDEARSTREVMEERGVKKTAGFSSVEVEMVQHKFIAHGRKQCQSIEMYALLNLLSKEIRDEDDYVTQDYHFLEIVT